MDSVNVAFTVRLFESETIKQLVALVQLTFVKSSPFKVFCVLELRNLLTHELYSVDFFGHVCFSLSVIWVLEDADVYFDTENLL